MASTQPQAVIVTQGPMVGKDPVRMTCPSCHASIVSKVESAATTKTHLLALLCCNLGCCCVPYFMDSCKGHKHTCPNCGTFLGQYNN